MKTFKDYATPTPKGNTMYANKTYRESTSKIDRLGQRQPRPQRRRTGTRHAIIALAIKEA